MGERPTSASAEGRLPPVPPFYYGVATADHQCEAYDPAYPFDVWDWWEDRSMVPQPRGPATDFWHRYPEDLDLARDLGCNAFRFSVSWARIEPTPGHFHPPALEHYARLAADVRDRGMEPFVTLCHFTWPKHVEAAGGLADAAFPDRFARYVETVEQSLGPSVRYWLTFNEPDNLVLNHSQLSRRMAPGAPSWRSFNDQIGDVVRLIRSLFLAHRQARAALRAGHQGESAQVTMNSEIRGIPIGLRRLVNWWLPRHFRLAPGLRRWLPSWLYRLVWSLTLLSEGDWWELGSLGRLPKLICPPGCADQWDYVAFDYYYGVPYLWQVPALGASLDGHFEREPVYAPGLYAVLRYLDGELKQRYSPAGKPIIVMENGVVDQRKALLAQGERPPRGAAEPARYLREHEAQVQRARRDGVNVVGYVVWSLTSNREWGLRFGPSSDFGLYHIDLDADPTLQRVPTAAAAAYRDIIAQRMGTLRGTTR